eukprot:CAMPEP_0202918884 /NCGR_PEP_ID=MMETSP1392-20130828/74457_1 /ASSEMBLY_ACC=CAM_ASM_000868 /TAXON_ID=225041 /ORGANISM="Chlamydomonas chlamydogama, Strain SAG 11-48b" /LENGTH=71 /DNA_ID=CAMNT_0049612057 /DNA_START=339 /DNA_END=555 /DNA_ORIENTATION=-
MTPHPRWDGAAGLARASGVIDLATCVAALNSAAVPAAAAPGVAKAAAAAAAATAAGPTPTVAALTAGAPAG